MLLYILKLCKDILNDSDNIEGTFILDNKFKLFEKSKKIFQLNFDV